MPPVPTRRDGLPPSVYPKGRWYWHVRAAGKKRIWTKLSLVTEGLPELYAALGRLLAEGVADDRMPAVVAAWQRDVMARHAPKTQRDDKARCKVVADSFAEFRAGQVRTADCAEFLSAFRAKPRTFNAYRSLLLELMRYSIERGWRSDNPVVHIRTLATPARTRYITDSELRRIKVGGIYGDDAKRTRGGLMLANLVDLLYLTGQRVGDVLELRWQRDPEDPDAPHLCDEGLLFRPSKVRGKTGARVLIKWEPKLRAVVERIRKLQAERLLKRRADQRVVSGYLITAQDGTRLTYWGASSAWQDARRRAGITDCTLHDIRAKALTDKEDRDGREQARRMSAHTTEQQLTDYLRGRKTLKTGPTR